MERQGKVTKAGTSKSVTWPPVICYSPGFTDGEDHPMNKFALAFAATLVLFGAAMADTYTLDAKGKCHDATGKFAKQALCAAPAAAHTYKLDAKGKCHDETGKFVKASLCHA